MIIGPVCAKRMGFMDVVMRGKEPALPKVRKDRAIVLDGQMLLFVDCLTVGDLADV